MKIENDVFWFEKQREYHFLEFTKMVQCCYNCPHYDLDGHLSSPPFDMETCKKHPEYGLTLTTGICRDYDGDHSLQPNCMGSIYGKG